MFLNVPNSLALPSSLDRMWLALKRGARDILALLYGDTAGPEELGDLLPDHLQKPIVGKDDGAVGNGRRCNRVPTL
jgi:hypothetical protein